MSTHVGKVAIITGGGQGLGQATARVFAAEGASVVVVDRNAETATAVAAAIAAQGGSAIPVACDVRHRGEVDATTRAAADAFGGIDILVQYAQIIKIETPLEHAPVEDFVDSWESGLIGSVNFMQSAFPYMKARGEGRIVNVASAAGLAGTKGCAAYASA